MIKKYWIILGAVICLSLVMLVWLALSSNGQKTIDQENKVLVKNDINYHGLPAEIISNGADFNVFLNNQEFLNNIFNIISTDELSLSDFYQLSKQDSLDKNELSPYFTNDGQPIFIKSDPPYHGEIIEYNENSQYALERSISEPDSLISLWNLEKKELYLIAQCGSACEFKGVYWLSSSKFVIFGIEKGYGEGGNIVPDSRFIRVYDLSENTVTVYSDKL